MYLNVMRRTPPLQILQLGVERITVSVMTLDPPLVWRSAHTLPIGLVSLESPERGPACSDDLHPSSCLERGVHPLVVPLVPCLLETLGRRRGVPPALYGQPCSPVSLAPVARLYAQANPVFLVVRLRPATAGAVLLLCSGPRSWDKLNRTVWTDHRGLCYSLSSGRSTCGQPVL